MIDLAQIRAFELPKIEKEMVIFGKKQTVSISPMKNTTEIKFRFLDENDPEDKISAIVYIVSDALGISEEDALKICEIDLTAANEIAVACNSLTKEFHAKQKEEREQAEKNSSQAAESTPEK